MFAFEIGVIDFENWRKKFKLKFGFHRSKINKTLLLLSKPNIGKKNCSNIYLTNSFFPFKNKPKHLGRI